MNMRKGQHLAVCIAFLLSMQAGFSQAFKSGDKVEALINNEWQQVQVLRAVPGKNNTFEVLSVVIKDNRSTAKTIQVAQENIRTVKLNVASNNAQGATAEEIKLFLGRYDLYSGIPTVYLGHILVQADGIYKVAFSADGTDYETGKYAFHPETGNIEWLSGLFKNKDWTGKLTKKSGGARIEFNKSTFAEKN
jgi:hypothetical protein